MPSILEPAVRVVCALRDVVEAVTRRKVLAVVAAVGLLTSCGGGGGDGDVGTPRTRSVDHALGTSEVPADPGRVVALGGIYVAALLRLGMTPVAIGDQDAFQTEPYAELLPEGADLESVPTVGDPYAPNVEAVAAQRPDLIVGDEFHGDFYDELSAIAPTVLVTYINNGGWRERFPKIAEAVGRSDLVAGIDAEYRAEIDAVPAGLADQTIAFVRASDDGGFRIDSLPTAFAGSVAEDAGIPTLRPVGVGEFDEGSGFLELSGERLDVLSDADGIVLGDNSFYDPETPDSLSQLEQNPLWASLPAVEAGRVLQSPGPVYNGGNYYAATLLLRALADL